MLQDCSFSIDVEGLKCLFGLIRLMLVKVKQLFMFILWLCRQIMKLLLIFNFCGYEQLRVLSRIFLKLNLCSLGRIVSLLVSVWFMCVLIGFLCSDRLIRQGCSWCSLLSLVCDLVSRVWVWLSVVDESGECGWVDMRILVGNEWGEVMIVVLSQVFVFVLRLYWFFCLV